MEKEEEEDDEERLTNERRKSCSVMMIKKVVFSLPYSAHTKAKKHRSTEEDEEEGVFNVGRTF